ncbi:Uncharacterised protein family UPF0324,prokaryote [Ostreococcus tauri]|uniref:Uncharacterized protein n=2 Tax=Ostreococcus tauri TaxID=70448 RepID=A0A090N3X4_OSTTA|nr:Uncharacterised protein family UPF0324,prokaryote [Ostreococcus tauri]CEF98873.1 Uncharacterised protein family UPF0324,prokaryote [Ostreococcus tauri]|eukprot:XP_022839520.1 Uncharacterised protein family UPF0324,prokaryote [Ostreococcus tauri]
MRAARGALACGAIAACAHGASAATSSEGRGALAPAAPIAVALGVAARRACGTKTFASMLEPGVRAVKEDGLKLGIAALGARLSLTEIGDTARAAAPAIGGVVVSGGVAAPMACALARRAGWRTEGLTRKTGALLAAGSSICGVTAIGALAPAIAATEREVGVAVANVVAYGTFGMLTYPYVAKWLFPDGGTPAGVFLGLSVHDTSQVIGAGMTFKQMYDDEAAFKAATVTKLTRNLGLAVVVPVLAMVFRDASETGASVVGKKPALIPGFLIAFIAMAALRSLGDATEGVRDDPRWKKTTKLLGDFSSQVALPCAMAAVGLSISTSSLSGIGVAPFFAGAVAATTVAGVAALSVKTLEQAGYLK